MGTVVPAMRAKRHPCYHEQVFEVFKRLDRREDFPGSGIGLALAQLAAEKLGASLRVVAPRDGWYTCFQVEVPVVGTDVRRQLAVGVGRSPQPV